MQLISQKQSGCQWRWNLRAPPENGIHDRGSITYHWYPAWIKQSIWAKLLSPHEQHSPGKSHLPPLNYTALYLAQRANHQGTRRTVSPVKFTGQWTVSKKFNIFIYDIYISMYLSMSMYVYMSITHTYVSKMDRKSNLETQFSKVLMPLL